MRHGSKRVFEHICTEPGCGRRFDWQGSSEQAHEQRKSDSIRTFSMLTILSGPHQDGPIGMQSVRQGILQTRQPRSVRRRAYQSELSPLTGCKDIADPIAGVFETELIVKSNRSWIIL
jgi:hypothetical protein